jgi:hypothetical protein
MLPTLLVFCLAAPADEVPATVTVQPAAIEIRHHRHPFALQVLGATADGVSLDLRARAQIVSADPKIATVDENGWVRPVASGRHR